jgi:hypothetical protein
LARFCCGVLLGALLLRANHQEVENREHQEEQTDLLGSAATAAHGSWRRTAATWRRCHRAATDVGLKQNMK